MTGAFPKQKIGKSLRTKEWFHQCGDHIIDQATYFSDDKWQLIELYKAAMGELDTTSYKYVLNPYNSTTENYKQFPARLRNIDIIIPILNLFLGEKGNRPFNHEVIDASPNTPNKNKDDLNKAFMSALSQHFVNGLNEQGVNTGVDTQQVPEFQVILNEYKIGASDKRAMFGQEALDFIKHSLSLKDSYQQAFYDWLVTGRVYTYKDVYKNDLLHEVVSPLEIWHNRTKTGFIEDCSRILRHTRYNVNDVIDRFHEVLSDKDVTTLEERFVTNESGSSNSFTPVTTDLDVMRDTQRRDFGFNKNDNLVDVYHTQWKGFVKVGILKYMDEMGGLQEMEVSEDYVLNKENGDIELEWQWMSMGFEQYRIDRDIYVYGREIQVQRQELSNSSKVKLSYNGRIGYNERDKVVSVVKQIMPYQALINIYNYRMELIVAKNKEKMMLMPIGLMPDGNGWNEDKFLYFMEATGIAFFDETKPNAQLILNSLKAIDMSLGNYIEQMRNLIISIHDQAWDAIGMNRQRYGDVNSSDGKATNEQAQIRSSVISREMNRRFEKFEESDLQGLIECSKLAWLDGKKGAYINSEGRKAFLELDGAMHLDTDYGIFVVDSQDEQMKLNKAKDYAFGFAQKAGVAASTVMEMLDSNNMSKLKALVNKAEDVARQYQESIAKQEQEAAMAMKQEEAASKDREGQIKLQVESIKSDTAIQVALIQNSGNAEEGGESQEDIDKKYDAYVEKTRDNDLKKQKEGLKAGQQAATTRLDEAKLKESELKRLSSEKIAKQNKNKYDK